MTNPWEKIYTESNPIDFEEPYSKFDLILSSLKKAKAKRVLDVAIGNGRHSIELAKNGFTVYGFDISKKIVDRCKNKLANLNLDANLITTSMFDIYPYPNNYFDGVVAIQAIYHGNKDDFSFAIKEARRVVKKGKTFFFTVSRNKERSTLGSNDPKFEKIDEYTLIPMVGREKGLIHFYPTKKMIRDIASVHFDKIKIIDDHENGYYLVVCS